MIRELQEFILEDKFSKEIWIKRGLIPSDPALCGLLQNELNEILQEIIELFSTKSEIVSCLKKSLNRFDRYELDTEEKELVVDYFAKISDIVSVDINNECDIWMYGFVSTDTSIKPIEILKSISTSCKKCKVNLVTDILKERQYVQPFWLIVQCDNCNEFSLLDIPENVDRYRTGKYFVFESLTKKNNTIEHVIDKMKFYRDANVD